MFNLTILLIYAFVTIFTEFIVCHSKAARTLTNIRSDFPVFVCLIPKKNHTHSSLLFKNQSFPLSWIIDTGLDQYNLSSNAVIAQSYPFSITFYKTIQAYEHLIDEYLYRWRALINLFSCLFFAFHVISSKTNYNCGLPKTHSRAPYIHWKCRLVETCAHSASANK